MSANTKPWAVLLVGREGAAFGVPMKQFKNSFVLHALGVQFGVICTFCRNRFNVDIPKQLRYMKLSFANVFTGNQKIMTERATK